MIKENIKLTSNAVKFQTLLSEEYTKLFRDSPRYTYMKTQNPGQLAKKMVYEILKGNALVDGLGVQSVCKQLKIKGNEKHIINYLLSE